ncbi:ArsR/SmtB family transcription factor [Aquibium oceanicum]|uniref:ArsR family transcriptional regulator n=1 Tax=Aquibium oceanicum TaxID=1670800 RepID=A0A1L3STS5_9HYPH|nr:metalloregulator ArsR/SmtB family transcription factor [Aquibium oceanicum]APH72798.1 ArsR family transcriptional regulator [Aquibium oceanicum]
MLTRPLTDLETFVDSLKAVAESSRMRILFLLSRGDLTVSDLTEILNQSQPRVSRHLKLLLDESLIGRYQEGSWAYFHLSDQTFERELVSGLIARIDTSQSPVDRDLERLEAVKRRRQERAASYFESNAASWDRIRSLHVPEEAVERSIVGLVGEKPFRSMLDLGTGTGRMLEILSPFYQHGIGVDMSREMLAIARAKLDDAGITNAQVRQGDIYAPPAERDQFDLVTIHQVLHYLDQPGRAIAEAGRVLRPSGRLLIVDFAPHEMEFLRDEHAHVRLGFTERQIADWLEEASLDLETTLEFEPQGIAGENLTVKLWLARDRRLLIADSIESRHQDTELSA